MTIGVLKLTKKEFVVSFNNASCLAENKPMLVSSSDGRTNKMKSGEFSRSVKTLIDIGPFVQGVDSFKVKLRKFEAKKLSLFNFNHIQCEGLVNDVVFKRKGYNTCCLNLSNPTLKGT